VRISRQDRQHEEATGEIRQGTMAASGESLPHNPPLQGTV